MDDISSGNQWENPSSADFLEDEDQSRDNGDITDDDAIPRTFSARLLTDFDRYQHSHQPGSQETSLSSLLLW